MKLTEKRLASLAIIGACATACVQADGNELTSQLERGEQLYSMHCSSCHEIEGGIGPNLTPRVLASYGTARRLLDYTRVTMPYGLPNSINGDDYEAIIVFLVTDRALADTSALAGFSADSIVLRAGGDSQ
jgi:mono/diheme cytochrome c family protein